MKPLFLTVFVLEVFLIAGCSSMRQATLLKDVSPICCKRSQLPNREKIQVLGFLQHSSYCIDRFQLSYDRDTCVVTGFMKPITQVSVDNQHYRSGHIDLTFSITSSINHIVWGPRRELIWDRAICKNETSWATEAELIFQNPIPPFAPKSPHSRLDMSRFENVPLKTIPF
ncbi:MAG: hypothetical protein NTV80_09690 [Verrucomicrobia bacterium]|nr:hypothetical protein [Verrucomicrobiota bacterium]